MNIVKSKFVAKRLVMLLPAISVLLSNNGYANPSKEETSADKASGYHQKVAGTEVTKSHEDIVNQTQTIDPMASMKPQAAASKDGSGLVNVALGKIATQSSNLTSASKAELAFDGNTDGNFQHGSVSHTSADPNAWLEIDLGKSEKIDHIVVWNRTDCCSDKLVNYWIFISQKPFLPTDTVKSIKNMKGVKAIKGEAANPSFTTKKAPYSGRYVRVQLDGSAKPENAYLHIAELQIYQAKK